MRLKQRISVTENSEVFFAIKTFRGRVVRLLSIYLAWICEPYMINSISYYSAYESLNETAYILVHDLEKDTNSKMVPW